MQTLSQYNLNRLEQKHLSNDSLENKKLFFENFFGGDRWVLMKSLPVDKAVRWQDYFSRRFFENYTSYLNEIQTKELIVYLENDELNKEFEMKFFYNLVFNPLKVTDTNMFGMVYLEKVAKFDCIKMLRTISLRKVIKFVDSISKYEQEQNRFIDCLFHNFPGDLDVEIDQEYATKFVKHVNDNHTEEPEVRRFICNYEETSNVYFDGVPNMKIDEVFDFFKSVSYKSFKNFPKNRIMDLLDFINDRNEIENKSEILSNLAKRLDHYDIKEEFFSNLNQSQFILICEYISDEVMEKINLDKFFNFILENSNDEEPKKIYEKFIIMFNKNKSLINNLDLKQILSFLTFCAKEHLEKESALFFCMDENKFEIFLNYIFENDINELQEIIFKNLIIKFNNKARFIKNLKPKQILKLIAFCLENPQESENENFFNSCKNHLNIKQFLKFIAKNVSRVDKDVLKLFPKIINFLIPEKILDLYEIWGMNVFDTNFKKFYELARYTLKNKKESKRLLVEILLQTPSLIKYKDFDFEIFCELILDDSGEINEELAARMKEYVPEFKLEVNYPFDEIPENYKVVLSYFIDDFNIESIYGFNEKLFFMEFYFNCHKDNWNENNDQKFECMWQNLFEYNQYGTLNFFFRREPDFQDSFKKNWQEIIDNNNNTKKFIQNKKEKIRKCRIRSYSQFDHVINIWEIGKNNELNDVIADILVNSLQLKYDPYDILKTWILSTEILEDLLKNEKIKNKIFEKCDIDLLNKLPLKEIFAMSDNISDDIFKQFFRNKRLDPMDCIDTNLKANEALLAKIIFAINFKIYIPISEYCKKFVKLLNVSDTTKEKKISLINFFYGKLYENFEEDAKNFWIYLFCPTSKLNDISINDFAEAYQLRNNYLSAIKKSNTINMIILVASCLAVLAAVSLFAVFGLSLLSAAIGLSIAIPLILFGVISIPICSRFVDKNNIERLSLTPPAERPKWAILYKNRNLNEPNISHRNTRAR